MYKLGLTALLLCGAFLTGCNATDEEKELLKEAQVDLEQLADQIIITYPANNSMITTPTVTIRADIPTTAKAQSMELFVDGIPFAKDTDGAPWEIEWPAYYWADNNRHTLLLKTTTRGGNEVRNNQEFSVTVSDSAGNDLIFKEDLDGSIHQNVNTIEVELTETPYASYYEILLVNGESQPISTETTRSIIEIPDVGDWTLKYRAVLEGTNIETLHGPWSKTITVSLIPPAQPEIENTLVHYEDGNYNVELSWAEAASENTYLITLANQNNLNEVVFSEYTTENSLVINELPIGTYQWKVTSSNQFGHSSLPSAPQIIEIGEYQRTYGGSNDDLAIDYASAKSGGLIILMNTKSTELFPSVDNQGDNLILRTNNQGEDIWSYGISKEGSAGLYNIIELEDESIIAVGRDISNNNAFAIKLNKEGELLWANNYPAESSFSSIYFQQATEFSSKLYVLANNYCSSCTTQRTQKLYALDINTGAILSASEMPSHSTFSLESYNHLISSDQNLILAGSAMPPGLLEEDPFLKGSIWIRLNSELETVSSWNNINVLNQLYTGDIHITEYGNIVTIGQSEAQGIAFTISDPNGNNLSSYAGNYSEFYKANTKLSSDVEGYVYAIAKDYSVANGTNFVYKFAANSTAERISIPHKNDSFSPVGAQYNSDDTITVISNEKGDNSGDYDLKITKAKLFNN